MDTAPQCKELIPASGPYLAPHCVLTGSSSSSLFHPDDYSLWLVSTEVAPAGQLEWTSTHGEEGIYVLDGELVCNGSTCTKDDVIILEAGVPATASTTTGARFLHLGTAYPTAPTGGLLGNPQVDGRRVHIIRSTAATVPERSPQMRYYADSTCPTCRITLFTVGRNDPKPANSHVHSEDEIIHVLEGEIRVGTMVVKSGMSIAIPGGYRYGYKTTGPYKFLNYRANVSTYVGKPGSTPMIETLEARPA